MKTKKFLKLLFSDTTQEQNDQLIALLASIGYTGFEEEEKKISAFIEEDNFNNDELADVLKLIPVGYSKTIINDENWNTQWESSFEPIIINEFAGIRAGFHQPLKNVRYQIIITPKMSFGTGHHATTYMMIEQMEAIDFKNKKVVDFGTGTAVLAILAEKMGAASVDAIDYDEWSIDNSKENVAVNHCSKINLIKADAVSANETYNIILANINLNVIKKNLAAIKKAAVADCIILLSGFLKSDETEMVDALAQNGFIIQNTMQNAEWNCILAKNKR